MSKFIIGKDRNQTEFFCVEQLIDSANIVRIIDLFVDSLSMKDMGFKTPMARKCSKYLVNG
jgi:hypothetical protein